MSMAMCPFRRGIKGRVLWSLLGQRVVRYFGAGPQAGAPGLLRRRHGVDGAGGE